MIARRNGGQEVEPGSYWNPMDGDCVHLDDAGILPGDKGTTFYRMPTVMLMLVAPLMGLAYVMFLPFIGFAMLISLIGQQLVQGAAAGLWRAAAFGWRPTEAYLLGRKHAKKGKKADEKEDPPTAG